MKDPTSEASSKARASEVAQNDPVKAERQYKAVLANDPGSDDTALTEYEAALTGLGRLYRDHRYVVRTLKQCGTVDG